MISGSQSGSRTRGLTGTSGAHPARHAATSSGCGRRTISARRPCGSSEGATTRGLPLDLTVHIVLSASALARRTEPDLAWTLPAYERYADEVDPATWVDVVVRADDPRHPAIVERD